MSYPEFILRISRYVKTIKVTFMIYSGLPLREHLQNVENTCLKIKLSTLAMFPANGFLYESEMHGGLLFSSECGFM